ncbi:MAG: nitroreductase [Crocinitomicaceae bacterium]|jgi:nitroreductase
MTILHKLEWRYATKKFDSEKQVSEENITELLKAMNLTASSYGLQPYEFIVIKNQELQNTLMSASYDQSQVGDASHVIVIAAKTKMTESYIEEYIAYMAELREKNIEELKGYRDMMVNTINSMTDKEYSTWAQKQCYAVLGTLLLAAADLKIDACPMEGFDNKKYNELLDLDSKNLHATLVIPVGYRSVDDDTQHDAKVRRPLTEIAKLEYNK